VTPARSLVLCVCGFRGELGGRESCPACGAGSSDRLSPARIRVLLDLKTRPPERPAHIQPQMRIWLASRGLILLDSSFQALASRRGSPLLRRYVLTAKAIEVLGPELAGVGLAGTALDGRDVWTSAGRKL
jgi:hypothetical protein